MYSISLSGLRFWVSIGVYPEERILKNEIEINLALSQKNDGANRFFLDYEVVFNLVREECTREDTLLENLIERIKAGIKALFPNTTLKIEIRKLNPPFKGTANYAAVGWDGNL